jgi:D-3-phosphoglycerate dehydrogenase / 2-oxoglutarate reductase
MKIVCVGDIFLPPEMMEAATQEFTGYTEVKYFFRT